MAEIKFTLETITPLFLGGAEPRGIPELRAASFRGALRFWLRALLGGMIGDAAKKLDDLRKVEAGVFGSTDIGASAVTVRIQYGSLETKPFSQMVEWRDATRQFGKPGIAYLFFAARKTGSEAERNAISAGTSFELSLSQRSGAGENNEKALQQACAALWLLTHLGGLGSRSRRAAGGLQVTQPERMSDDLPPFFINAHDSIELQAELQDGLKCIRHLAQAFVGISAVATVNEPSTFDVLHPNVCRIVVLNKQWKIWKQALDEIGQKFANFRYQLAPEYPAIEQIVLAKAGIGTAPKLTGVNRAAFGLPLPFYFRSVQQALENRGVNRQKARREAQAIIKPTQEGVDRRASPLLIRAARLANGQYTLVITVFKAELLEHGEKLALKQDQRVLRKTIPTPGLGLIDTFLDDLKSSIPLLEVEHW